MKIKSSSPKSTKITKNEAKERVRNLLEKVGLPRSIRERLSYPHQLSGGQRQRAMIAMALSNNPKLLIADEPTTALDVSVESQILSLLGELKEEFGMSMLFITHDLNLVRRIATKVAVMKSGQIIERGQTKDVLQNPKEEYTRKLVFAHEKIVNTKKIKPIKGQI